MPILASQSAFQEFCISLLNSPQPLAVAIDMEFMRETTYWPKLCLLQMASSCPGLPETILADPLSNINLDLFKDILEAPHLIKVFHSGRQDLEICWHKWQTLPVNYFDTQVAAMVCGLGEATGYNTLVKKLLDVDIKKDLQHTDWSCRPLTEQQVSYAQGDVVHLLAMYPFLQQKLSTLNRWEWMKDDLKVLLEVSTYQVDPKNAWHRLYSSRIKNLNLRVLQDVCTWREEKAIQLNVNRRRVLEDETILELATKIISTKEDMWILVKKNYSRNSVFRSTIKGAGNSFASPDLAYPKILDTLYTVYESALQAQARCLPNISETASLTYAEKQILIPVREKLKEVAASFNVPERLIAPKHTLFNLIKGNIEGNIIFSGWRNDVFGKHIIELVKK